jgi:hypothetical protein
MLRLSGQANINEPPLSFVEVLMDLAAVRFDRLGLS